MGHPQIITLQDLSKLLRHHPPLRRAMIVKEIEIHSPTPWVHGIKIRSISPNPRHQLSVLTRLHRAFDGVLTVLKELHQIFERFF